MSRASRLTYNSEERGDVSQGNIPRLSSARVQPVSEAELFRNAQDAIKEMSSQTVDSILNEATIAIQRIRAVKDNLGKPRILQKRRYLIYWKIFSNPKISSVFLLEQQRRA